MSRSAGSGSNLCEALSTARSNSVAAPSTGKGSSRREYSRSATSSVQSDLLKDLSVLRGTSGRKGNSCSAWHWEPITKTRRSLIPVYLCYRPPRRSNLRLIASCEPRSVKAKRPTPRPSSLPTHKSSDRRSRPLVSRRAAMGRSQLELLTLDHGSEHSTDGSQAQTSQGPRRQVEG
jgi:hypothetical protein